MAYSQDELIELTAIKVQEIVCPKIEHFMDGVTKEVHDMHLEMKGNREFDATVIAQLNDVRADVEGMASTKSKVAEVHTLFCKNGYMQKFNKLYDDWVSYLARDRMLTCPVADDVKQIVEERKEERRLTEARRNGEIKTRREDKYRSLTLVIALFGNLAAWITLGTKMAGWW